MGNLHRHPTSNSDYVNLHRHPTSNSDYEQGSEVGKGEPEYMWKGGMVEPD